MEARARYGYVSCSHVALESCSIRIFRSLRLCLDLAEEKAQHRHQCVKEVTVYRRLSDCRDVPLPIPNTDCGLSHNELVRSWEELDRIQSVTRQEIRHGTKGSCFFDASPCLRRPLASRTPLINARPSRARSLLAARFAHLTRPVRRAPCIPTRCTESTR